MKIMKHLKSSVMALAATAMFAGAATAAEPVTFQMSWKAQVEFAGFYQAKEKGFYSECGIDMTIREGAPGIDPTQLLTAGAVQAAVVSQNDGVMRMNIAGFPAKAVMASVQKFLTVMMYHDESGIKTPEDMKGKPVMISQGNRTTFWPFLKTKYGYTDDQLRTYNGQTAMWMSDKTSIQQGVITQEPFRVQAETGKMPPYFLLSDMGYNPYTVLVVVSQKMIDEKPAVVQCLVDASRKGWADFMKNPKVAMDALQKANPQAMTPDLMNFTYKMMKDQALIENEETAKLGIGAMTDARWKSHFDMLVANNIIPASFDYKSAFTTKFLEKPIN